jgi:hypothetical protein
LESSPIKTIQETMTSNGQKLRQLGGRHDDGEEVSWRREKRGAIYRILSVEPSGTDALCIRSPEAPLASSALLSSPIRVGN